MKDIVDLLKGIKAKRIKVISVCEVVFKYYNSQYTISLLEDCITIKNDSIVYSFDRNEDTLNLISDFLNM